jgi:hypothetical protein
MSDEEKARNRELYDRAKAEAQSRAPRPIRDPGQTGMFGAIIAVGVLFLFCMVAGIRTEAVEVPFAITVVLCFLVPWGTLKYQERRHSKAVAEAYARLKAAEKQPT